MADDRVWLTAEDVAEIVTILDGSPFNQLDLRTTRFRLRVAREQAGEAAGEWSQAWDWADGAALPGAAAIRPCRARSSRAAAPRSPPCA